MFTELSANSPTATTGAGVLRTLSSLNNVSRITFLAFSMSSL